MNNKSLDLRPKKLQCEECDEKWEPQKTVDEVLSCEEVGDGDILILKGQDQMRKASDPVSIRFWKGK